jgi:putative sigma-54 modulation protein
VRLLVKGKNVEVSEQIRQYAEEKLAKLGRQLNGPTQVELELAVERNPSIANNNVAEATVWTKGPVLRAREASADMKASIDQLAEKLERQAIRYREKRRDHRGQRADPLEVTNTTPDEDEMPQIVKTKQFAVKPMSPEEAVLQLELIGHDFFVFRHAETGEVNVVYGRHDGGYGLIEPQ